jgi:hypothetical protein
MPDADVARLDELEAAGCLAGVTGPVQTPRVAEWRC